MKKGILFSIIIIQLIILTVSCQFDADEYCDIEVMNNTNETVKVFSRSWFFDNTLAWVESKSGKLVSVPVGTNIYITGQDTKREWGPRIFYYYQDWLVP